MTEARERGRAGAHAGLLVAVLAGSSAAFLAGQSAAEDPERAAAASSGSLESDVVSRASPGRQEQVRQALEAGLRSLLASSRRSSDGGLGRAYPVAATSLAGLAVLGAGKQPDQEPWARFLKGAVSYLLARMRSSGFIHESDVSAAGEGGSRMHGHCYAVLFLTQMTGSLSPETERRVRRAIDRGVRVIEKGQSREGGWWYTPDARDGRGRERDEASVTICALQALRAARNVGVRIDATRIRRAVEYVKRCQGAEGGFRYSLSDRSPRITFALTAAAVSTLNAAGVYRSPECRRGLEHLRKSLSRYRRHPERAVEEQFFFYGNLYTALALYQDGGPMWASWYPRVRDNLTGPHLLRRTPAGGHWESPFGDEYATAMALLILEIPLGYLPIFQR